LRKLIINANFESLIMKAYLLIVPLFLALEACGLKTSENSGNIEEGFRNIPDSITAWTYWYWMNDYVSKEGITKDLESMAEMNITKAFIGNIGDEKFMASGDVTMLGDEWWKLMRWALKEGKRTGVEIGIFNGPGWSQSGGPWITPDNSMRYLISSEHRVAGPQKLKIAIDAPKEPFQEVALLAFPAPSGFGNKLADIPHNVKCWPALNNIQNISDGDLSSSILFPEEERDLKNTIEFTLKRALVANSIIVHPAQKRILADCELYAEIDGAFKEVKHFEFDRQNESLNVGPLPYAPIAISLEGIKSDKFRLIINFKRDRRNDLLKGGIKEIELSESPVLERYIEKQLAKLHQTPVYSGTEYQWKTQKEISKTGYTVNHESVKDISNRLNDNGILEWEVPEGEWIIQYIGMTPTNVTNHPVLPHARGLEVDRLDTSAVRYHFDSYVGKILETLSPEERDAFKYLIIDSYETGSQNWSDHFRTEFINALGYDPIPWLPVFSGKIVESAEKSDRFLWDLRRFISDQIAKKYVGGLKKAANDAGAELWLENYGHWGFPGESLIYGGYSDHVAGEFWNEGPLGNWECKIASSTAHIYGKNIVSAESFTTTGMAFQRSPMSFKKRGDWSYTEGINQVVLTLFIHQFDEYKKPGVNAWFGSEINRHNTWFDMSKPWIDYQLRNNFLLQQGRYVADVCYFIGEDAPKSNGIQEPPLPQGYSFDFINYDVIMNHLDVKDGRFILPDGMSYKVMVLPESETMRPELLLKISNLVEKGGIILGSPPIKSPGLENYPDCDEEVSDLSEKLWDNIDGVTHRYGAFGKGMVFRNMNMEEVFENLKLNPDFKTDEEVPVLWTHRKTEDMEIYFITNQGNKEIAFNASFRVENKEPEWWNGIDGSVRTLPEYESTSEGIEIPIRLEPMESGFVVFKNNAGPVTSSCNFPDYRVVREINTSWEVTFTDPFGVTFTKDFDELKDWRMSQDEQIRYFSGKVIYRSSFELDNTDDQKNIYLNLGNVMVIAKVKINGKEVGGLWTRPWRLEVSDYLKEGKNELEIEVANNWVNRLTGDAKLKVDERVTWLSLNQFKADGQLQPSGLLGPVTIEIIDSK
jgi:hypothetical protein